MFSGGEWQKKKSGVYVCAYEEAIESRTQGNDLPVNTAKLGLEALPAACMIAL